MEEQLHLISFHKKEKKFLILIKVVLREDVAQLQKTNVKEQRLINVKERTKIMGEREMGGHWSPEERRKISTLWQKKQQGKQEKISKMRTPCKSHTDDKWAKGECCQQKESCG